jgi:hypothetical protein
VTRLIELPSNTGTLIAVDPHSVTAVQAYRGTLPGRGSELFDMSAVWVDRRNIYVCAWSVEQALAVLNAARQSDADVFAAGFRAGSAWEATDVEAAWITHLASTRTPETAL